MDPSIGQHQEMSSHSMENMLVCSKAGQERKQPRPQPDQALNCPRCDSTNTKFCYYNNYSLSQPRYFCKSCRRYWTKGGTLRNVPVGGGCRKSNKRPPSSSSSPSLSSSCSSSSFAKRAQDQNPLALSPLGYDSNDLTLAFARLQRQQASGRMGYDHHDHEHHFSMSGNPSTIHSSPAASSAPLPPPPFFHETRNTNFLYYGGYGNVENNSSGEMVMPYGDVANTQAVAVAVAPMKQELGNGNGNYREENENRILWGFPWQQINGSGSINIMGGGGGGGGGAGGGEFESSSARESWIDGFGSTWHGLLNSVLM